MEETFADVIVFAFIFSIINSGVGLLFALLQEALQRPKAKDVELSAVLQNQQARAENIQKHMDTLQVLVENLYEQEQEEEEE